MRPQSLIIQRAITESDPFLPFHPRCPLVDGHCYLYRCRDIIRILVVKLLQHFSPPLRPKSQKLVKISQVFHPNWQDGSSCLTLLLNMLATVTNNDKKDGVLFTMSCTTTCEKSSALKNKSRWSGCRVKRHTKSWLEQLLSYCSYFFYYQAE